jgi:hypothetical protein
MNSKTLLSTNLLRRACMLGIVLSMAILTTNAEALSEPKVTITYSLETIDGGAYHQKIYNTPLGGAGDVDYVVNEVDSGDVDVDVLVDNPLRVIIEFTADSPGGNIIDGPVDLAYTYFRRQFEINSLGLALVNTDIRTRRLRKGTGTLSGSTISWNNGVGVAYQESVTGRATCTGLGCDFVSDPFPRDLSEGGPFEVLLPDFTLFTINTFGDAFASDHGTPGNRLDDIDRPDPDADVVDLWEGVEVPEPSREILLFAGALGLVGLSRLRERGGASA